MGTTQARIGWGRPPIKGDLPPELPIREGLPDEGPTEAQKAQVLREAVSSYIRDDLRAPDVREICEEFIAAIDQKLRDTIPLPDVPGVSITPVGVFVPLVGGTGDITVSITSPGLSGTWTVDKDATADWLTYTPTTPQSMDGIAQWTAEPNTGPARTAHLYINGKTFTVDQDGLPA